MAASITNHFIPEPIRTIIKSSPTESERTNRIREALRDRSTRVAFDAWANAHKALLWINLNLRIIDRTIRQIAPNEPHPNLSMTSYIGMAFSRTFFSDVSLVGAKEMTILFDAGLIDEEEYLQSDDLFDCISDIERLKNIIPFLYSLHPSTLTKILSYRGRRRLVSPMSDPETVKILLPLLTTKYTAEHYDLLFSMLKARDLWHNTPLHDKDVLALIMQFFRIILLEKPQQFRELMLMMNRVTCPLHLLDFEMLDHLKEYLPRLTFYDVWTLMHRNDSLWNEAMCNPSHLRILVYFINKLSPNDMFTLLSETRRDGTTILQNPELLQILLPVLKNCSYIPTPISFEVGLKAPFCSEFLAVFGKSLTIKILQHLCRKSKLDEEMMLKLLNSPHLNIEKKKSLFLEQIRVPLGTYRMDQANCLSSLRCLKAAMPILQQMSDSQWTEFLLSIKPYIYPIFFADVTQDYQDYFEVILPQLLRLSKTDLFVLLSEKTFRHDLICMICKTSPPNDVNSLLAKLHPHHLFEIVVSKCSAMKVPLLIIRGVIASIGDMLKRRLHPAAIVDLLIESEAIFYPLDPDMIAFIASLAKWQRKELLFVQNTQGNRLLKTYEKEDPLLHDFDNEEISYFSSLPDQEDHTPDDSIPSWNTIRSGSSDEVYIELSKRDMHYATILHKDFKHVFPYLKKLPFSQRKELLSMCNHRGETPYIDMLSLLYSGLAEGIDQHIELLEIRNMFGQSLLDDPKAVKFVLSHLIVQEDREKIYLKLNPYRVQMLLLRDFREKEPDEELYALLLPVFERMPKPIVVHILSQMNERGETPMHYFTIFKALLPLLQEFDDFAVALLSTKNSLGSLPFYDPHYLKNALPFIATFPVKVISELFSKVPTQITKVLESVFFKWIASQHTVTQHFKALGLTLIMGYTLAIDYIRILSPDAINKIFGVDAPHIRAAIISKFSFRSLIRPQHMKEGKPINNLIPPAADMNQAPLIRCTRYYTEFYDFLPDLISSATEEGSLDQATELELSEVARHIKQNTEATQQMSRDDAVRQAQYRNYVAYLTHVVIAYRIGQGTLVGNLEDKMQVLLNIADLQKNCFPRWIEQIQQIYFARPGPRKSTEVLLTFKDRVLAITRAARLDILIHSMAKHKGNVHEINYFRDLFREDFGTLLEPINDPASPELAALPIYHKDVLRKEFDVYYTREFLINLFHENINAQFAKKPSDDDPMKLLPNDIVECISDWYRSKWTQEASNHIIGKVSRISDVKEKELFLEFLGISWDSGQTVAEAENQLRDSIKNLGSSLTNLAPSIARNIANVREMAESETYPLEVKNLITRYSAYILSEDKDLNSFESTFLDWEKGIMQRCEKLRFHREKLIALPLEQKRDYMILHSLIEQGQPIESVLTHETLRDVQVNIFIANQIFDDNRRFTKHAASCLLTACGVLKVDNV